MAQMAGSQPVRQFQLKGFPNLIKMAGGPAIIFLAIATGGNLERLLWPALIIFFVIFWPKGKRTGKAISTNSFAAEKHEWAREKHEWARMIHEAKMAGNNGQAAISPLQNDAISALMHLGYTKGDAANAVSKAMESGANEFESIVKAALMQGGR